MQDAVSKLIDVAPKLTGALDDTRLQEAARLLDTLEHPLSQDEIAALISLLPDDGDPAQGLNWTILHAIEAAPSWPIWNMLLPKGSEWIDLFLTRLRNGGINPPEGWGG